MLYDRVTAAQKVTLHRRIGEREEQAYGRRATDIAMELAVHFERGRDFWRAVQYLQQAGENAMRRNAHDEAIKLLTKGLELLKTLPDTLERTRQEITLQLFLRTPLITTKGLAAPEVEHACSRALDLCRQLGELPQLFAALMGLWSVRLTQADVQTARKLGEQCLRLAQSENDFSNLMWIYNRLGMTLFHSGEFALAHHHLE